LSTTWTSLRIEETTGALSLTIFWEIGVEGLRVAQPVTNLRQIKKVTARNTPQTDQEGNSENPSLARVSRFLTLRCRSETFRNQSRNKLLPNRENLIELEVHLNGLAFYATFYWKFSTSSTSYSLS
jgi:hypothetical protein